MSFLRPLFIVTNSSKSASCSNIFIASRCFSGKKLIVPEPPKRPMSAYMLFCKENRQQLLKENPSLKATEQIQILAAKWKQMGLNEKKPYELLARENTVSYSEEHKKFYESLTDEQKEAISRMNEERKEIRRLKKLTKEIAKIVPEKPKRPPTAYNLFVQDNAPKTTGSPSTDFLKSLGEKWKQLPERSKKLYEEKAKKLRERYSAELDEWHKKIFREEKHHVLEEAEQLKKKIALRKKGSLE